MGPCGGGHVGFGSQPWWGLVRGGGGPAKGAEAGWRPGRRGTALMLVAVGSRARLPGGPVRASVGAHPSPEPLPPRAPEPSPAVRPLPVATGPPPPPLCARLDQMAEGVSCPRSALSGPKPASPLLGVVPSPAANGFVCGGGGRPRAKCSRPLVRRRGRARVAGRAGCVCGGGGLASLRVRESVLGAGRDGGVVVAARAPRGCQGPPGAGSVSSGAMGPPLCWRPWAVGPRVPRWPTSGFEAPLKGP